MRNPSFLLPFYANGDSVPSSLLLFHGSTSDSAIPPCSREGDPEGARECCPVSTVKEVATPYSKAFSHRRRRVAVAGSPSPRSIPFTEQQSCHGAAVQSPTRLQWPSQSNTPTRATISIKHSCQSVTKPSHAKSNSTMSSSESPIHTGSK
ncbi:uncharacterized protein LOC110278286 [Arachis duranensis]|uniref:Uncharacterized protein LOC110278286 n=1 Tax=Arachis duranensis TaxID=130453 RepID=A0A9C6TS38_ARADU|nr:uncharacterized protein LOC110278286 [Arachis duranensis]